MKKIISPIGIFIMLVTLGTSCTKTATNEVTANTLTQDEKAMVAAAGFNSNWAERTAEGSYLIEGDIFLNASQLKAMSGVAPTHNIIVGNEEHYRTYNVVSTPTSGARTITVRITNGFPSYYSTSMYNSYDMYNDYN